MEASSSGFNPYSAKAHSSTGMATDSSGSSGSGGGALSAESPPSR
jgi:hypothetical protein